MLILLIEKQRCSGKEFTLKNYIYAQFFFMITFNWSKFMSYGSFMWWHLRITVYIVRLMYYVNAYVNVFNVRILFEVHHVHIHISMTINFLVPTVLVYSKKCQYISVMFMSNENTTSQRYIPRSKQYANDSNFLIDMTICK